MVLVLVVIAVAVAAYVPARRAAAADPQTLLRQG
jgi:ABC-type lipoprotein release transport system permease subunit